MAAVVKGVSVTENRLNNAEKPSVVVLDSDEEEEQTPNEVFQGFINAVQPFLERKEILLLRVKFAEIRPEYACGATFREMLRRKTNQVRKTDVYIHFNEVLKDLISNAALYGRNAKQNRDGHVKSVGESTSDPKTDSSREERITATSTTAGKFESDRHVSNHITSTPGTSAQSGQSDQVDIQIVDLDGQSSSNHLSKDTQERLNRKKKRKKRVMKLERKLNDISNEIKRLSQSELSLEEMGLSDSNYIRESRLKEQFNKTWERICDLKGRPPDTGRVIEKKVKVKGTKFPSIDKAVSKFLKRKKGFPNIFDIRNIVIRANKKHGLGLTPGVQQEIAADVFTDIGNKIQKKRKKDYEYNFGCHLTDDCLSSLDPALNDYNLRKKLEENKKVSQSALENIFQKYVHLDRLKGQSNNDSPATSDSDDEYSDNDELVQKKSKRKKRDSPDSCDEDRKVKRAKIRERPTATITSTLPVTKQANGTDLPSNNPLPDKPADDGSSHCIVNGVVHESIEIIDDDDDDDLTVSSDHQTNRKVNHSTHDSATQPSVLNKIDNSTNSTKLTNGTEKSVHTASPQKEIQKTVNPPNLQNGDDKLLNSPNLSNQTKGQSIVVDKKSQVQSKDCINTVFDHEDKEHLNSTQRSAVSCVEQCTTTEKTSIENSLVSGNSPSTSKLNICASKLHVKIQQLRVKKLSGLLLDESKTACPNTRSEDRQSGNHSDLPETRHKKRKSTNPHHIQEHVNGTVSSTYTINKTPVLGITNDSSEKAYDIVSDNSSVSQLSSTSNYPLKDTNKYNVTQPPHVRVVSSTSPPGKKSLIESPVRNSIVSKPSPSKGILRDCHSPKDRNSFTVTTNDHSPLSRKSSLKRRSLSTVDTNGHVIHNGHKHSSHQITTSNGASPCKRPCQGLSSVISKSKASPRKNDTIIILSDDED